MENIVSKSKKYFLLQYNQKVDSPEEKNFVGYSVFKDRKYKVVISNRSLKHFIESRKDSFIKNNDEEYAIDKIIEMWTVCTVVLEGHDFSELLKNGRLEIRKDMRFLKMRNLRIVMDVDEENCELQIVTYHPFS